MGKQLAQNVNLDGVLYQAGTTPPKDIAEQITNPKAWGSDESDDTSTADAGTNYASMKVADLKSEIEKRNEGRDDDALLSTEGNKGELVKVLEADDNASA